MSIPNLADLREPPVVGRWYQVPVLDIIWLGRRSIWPVIGPAHDDADHFDFPHRHYHVDARFLTASQATHAAARLPFFSGVATEFAAAQSYPIGCDVSGDPDPAWVAPRGRPPLVGRRCRTSLFPYEYGGQSIIAKLREAYGGESATAIRLADGRLLCPHQKANISSIAPDADGRITCPLHGLRLCVPQ